MDNIIKFSLSAEDSIAVLRIVVTIIIAVIGGIYAIITNMLTEDYKQELFAVVLFNGRRALLLSQCN